MAMMNCPSCGKDVSTEAAACPNCGHAFKYAGGLNLGDPVHLLGIFGLVVFLGIVGFFIWAQL
jgi:hypothetical protein